MDERTEYPILKKLRFTVGQITKKEPEILDVQKTLSIKILPTVVKKTTLPM